MRLVLMEETSLRACSVVITGVYSMDGGPRIIGVGHMHQAARGHAGPEVTVLRNAVWHRGDLSGIGYLSRPRAIQC
jgi:hypothetical protein